MSDALFSSSWYRVADLRPRLRAHARIHRHVYRGQVWFVVEDQSMGRHHRLTTGAHLLVSLMDGRHSVQQIWDRATSELGDDAPTQDETIQLLGQLHSSDVLLCDTTPDTLELFRRYERNRRRQWLQKLAHPLAIRLPLFDPARALDAGLPWVRWLFGWTGFLLWAAVVGVGIVLAAENWTPLTENIADQVLAPSTLLAIWLVYPVIKGLHEFGHAFATRVWGGEVHEMGVMLLVLVPVPYVEASAASAFSSKRRRAAVGAMGIMVEMFLAAVAMMVWVSVESGVVSAVAYSVMLIGGVSTLFFNGNPLLRFDGYYVLADLVEIPNLANRSKSYLGYLFQRYLFGVHEARNPAMAPGERGWFLFYGVASFVYRFFILFVIILFIASKFFVVGALLATWAVISQLLMPLGKTIAFVTNNGALRKRRQRAVLTSSAGIALLLLALFAVPVPLTTRAQGITWLPDQAQVRAGAGGFVTGLLVEEGAWVEAGTALVATEDPLLGSRVALLDARMTELDARLAVHQFSDRAAADVVRREMAAVQADLVRARERLDALVIRAATSGYLVVPRASDLPGRYLNRGEVVGYVTLGNTRTIRVAVGQDDVGLVRERTRGVAIMPPALDQASLSARITREVPAASDRLPNVALGTAAGGEFPVDPGDPDGLRTLAPVFQYELSIADADALAYLGQRVQVRFDHGGEALGLQWYRGLRQLFLRQFGV
ncbi:MAG TPA: hypothetical protein VLA56_15430 [Pseudomonadales bacterium]|nr:hypothetical protein [Pseudomonadales bacterium]